MTLGRRRFFSAWPLTACLALCCLPGCRPKQPPVAAHVDYSAPLPPGELALRKIPPEQYPDFSAGLAGANINDLRRAIDNSLVYLDHPGSTRGYPYLDITHDRAIASLRAFRALLDQNPPVPADRLNALIAERFEVYQSIGAPAPAGDGYTGRVLFTGYFTPTYDASLTRGGPYQWPIYKRPADLISDETGEGAGRRTPDGSVVPYYTRREVESGALAGQELAWVASRWNAYVITIQGSARLRLPIGKIFEVGYAGTNGREYTSPGGKMIQDKVIAREQINFQTLKQYFDAHPEAMDTYLWQNERTVFFTERPGGPFGALNVPVTPFCSIATDKKVYPPAMLAFISVPIPRSEDRFPGSGSTGFTSSGDTRPFSGFLLDQDRGGAIRSAGRCDIYMGIGEHAEQTAGHQLNPGSMYYLAVKQ